MKCPATWSGRITECRAVHVSCDLQPTDRTHNSTAARFWAALRAPQQWLLRFFLLLPKFARHYSRPSPRVDVWSPESTSENDVSGSLNLSSHFEPDESWHFHLAEKKSINGKKKDNLVYSGVSWPQFWGIQVCWINTWAGEASVIESHRLVQ